MVAPCGAVAGTEFGLQPAHTGAVRPSGGPLFFMAALWGAGAAAAFGPAPKVACTGQGAEGGVYQRVSWRRASVSRRM